MDGIAVKAADTAGAGESTPVVLPTGQFDVVDTGDPLPARYDAVVMREHVHRTAEGAEVRAAVPPFQHVRSIGEDISATELLLPEGHRLRPVDVAACAAAGLTELMVRRRPLVVIVPTGDEIRPIGEEPAPGEIPDTNSLMLAAQARELGCEARVTGIIADDPELITAALREAAREADLVILVAGSSAGRDDYTARVVAGAGTLAVHGVAVRPGHPVVLGTVAGEMGTPVLGAPGYPVSAALTFDIFAAPMLAGLEGAAPRERPSTTARLARKLASAIGVDDWVRVRLGRVEGDIVATPLPRGAGVLTSLVRADGLLVVPGRGRGSPRRRAGRGGVDARPRRDRPDDRGHRVARPRSRRGSLRTSRSRPPRHARLIKRRVPRRPGGTQGRAVPPRRLTPARRLERRVHAPVRGPAARRGPPCRRHPPRPP